jgi:hypothetical protein
MKKRNLDKSAINAVFVVLITTSLHKIAGGSLPNLIFLFGFWSVLTAVFYVISHNQITWQKTLMVSMISQPVIHSSLHSQHSSSLQCSPTSHHQITVATNPCSSLASANASGDSSSISMIFAHLFAIMLIQISTQLTLKAIQVASLKAKNSWIFRFGTCINPIKIEIKVVQNFLENIKIYIDSIFQDSLIRRGPPVPINS